MRDENLFESFQDSLKMRKKYHTFKLKIEKPKTKNYFHEDVSFTTRNKKDILLIYSQHQSSLEIFTYSLILFCIASCTFTSAIVFSGLPLKIRSTSSIVGVPAGYNAISAGVLGHGIMCKKPFLKKTYWRNKWLY